MDSVFKSLGKNPSGIRLKKIKKSANYRNGSFQNQSQTSVMTSRIEFFKVLRKVINKPKNVRPPQTLPSVISDLRSLSDEGPVIVWFGHSSYLIKINGKHVLVDPVFCGYASPFKNKSAMNFDGSNVFGVDDMPHIDVLLITHDHYDHCDYESIVKLNKNTTSIITSLGVASHLEYWGIDKGKITELDWNENTEINGLTFTSVPARHFSGRSFIRCKTLWASFILKTKDHSIYIGADSGYDKHFKEIGRTHGPFDIAILESGQYNTAWKSIHMFPEETAQASIDVKAKALLPVHWGKFSMAIHPWDEPIERLVNKAEELNVPVVTPMIGEPIIVGKQNLTKKWWRSLTNVYD